MDVWRLHISGFISFLLTLCDAPALLLPSSQTDVGRRRVGVGVVFLGAVQTKSKMVPGGGVHVTVKNVFIKPAV